MIPKTIHYCWFGHGKKPKLAEKCIASWQKYCPEYEIIEWNEDNFDVGQNGYTKMCHEQKKYAFLSDYVRLYVISRYGGLYFDTDVELLKAPDALLKHEAFFGFETSEYVASGLGFGSVANGTAVRAMLAEYEPFLEGNNGVVGCPILNTQALEKHGLVKNGTKQIVAGATIYPISVFNPYDAATGRLIKTNETVSVHWYAAAWQSKKTRLRTKITRPLHRIFGVDAFKRFRK